MRITLLNLCIAACWLSTTAAAVAEYRWTEVTKAATFCNRDGAGAVTFNHRMWILGGWADDPAGGKAHVGYNDVWSSTDGLRWTQVRPNTPNNAGVWDVRHCGGYVVFNNRMWIVGGDPLLKHYQPDVWSSTDGATWVRATANAPWGQRHLHVTMVHDGKIWVMGGQTFPTYVPGVPEAFFNDVWSSSDGANWTRVTEHAAWSPRGMIQGGVEFNGRMWLLGGGTYDTPSNRSGSSTTRFGVLRTASIGEKTRSRRGRRASTTASPCSTTRCGCSPAGTPTRRASIAKTSGTRRTE